MRLGAVCLAAALGLAQLLWAVHEAEALAHDPGEVCDLCLSLANVGSALVDLDPVPVLGIAAVDRRPTKEPRLAAPPREHRARAPPPHRR